MLAAPVMLACAAALAIKLAYPALHTAQTAPLRINGDAAASQTRGVAAPADDAIGAERDGASGAGLLCESGALNISERSLFFDNAAYAVSAEYAVANEGGGPIGAAFAFPYTGGLYWPENVSVTIDGEEYPFDVSVDWQPDGFENIRLDGGGRNGVRNFDEGAGYALYSIKVYRDPAKINLTDKIYIGADFTVDSSKTHIVADGFGYAANAYGAVRVFSLSDGFDAGLERRLYAVGEDISLEMKAYEDDKLTRETGALDIRVERRVIKARDYLLEYSAPYAFAGLNGAAANCNNEAAEAMQAPSPDSDTSHAETVGAGCIYADSDTSHAETVGAGRIYMDSLYRVYAIALDELMDVHYFIPRGSIYAGAETSRQNAIVFMAAIPAKTERIIKISNAGP